MPQKEYAKAYKQGKKAYYAMTLRGQAPYLPALEKLLEGKNIVSYENLGTVEIPLDQIVGTYYTGRQPSFSCDFQPLMPEDTEFASKWIALCRQHLQDGIRDPIKAREYMNRFYVVEGHKRVSVLKHFGAAAIRGEVIRLIPEPEDTVESRIYSEFLPFYRITGVNFVWFSREGGFQALLQATDSAGMAAESDSDATTEPASVPGDPPVSDTVHRSTSTELTSTASTPTKPASTASIPSNLSNPSAFAAWDENASSRIPTYATWSTAKRAAFRSFYVTFERAFEDCAEPLMKLTPGDAMLIYLKIFGYAESLDKTQPTIRTELSRIWNEIINWETGSTIQLVLKPDTSTTVLKAPRFLSRPTQIRAAFIHFKTAATSSWVYAHELGRKDLEAALEGRIETICLDGADDEASIARAFEAAIADNSDLIFTTSPRLLKASVKAAVDHPHIRILNCSLNTAHPSIRTYYARMYEAKFLMGVIAGCLTPDGNIGYIADYPIYGITANINAFALGAKMVNPRAKVYVEWSKKVNTKGEESRTRLYRSGISYISDQDMISADDSVSRHVGLYRSDGQTLDNTALSIWRWGRLYIKIVQNYLNGGWKHNAPDTSAINYWWGMESGVIDLICSRSLPSGTARLVGLLKDAIRNGSFLPFSGFIQTQTGETLDYQSRAISPEELITMDWLADNVVGSLPEYDELLPEAQVLVQLQGIRKA